MAEILLDSYANMYNKDKDEVRERHEANAAVVPTRKTEWATKDPRPPFQSTKKCVYARASLVSQLSSFFLK